MSVKELKVDMANISLNSVGESLGFYSPFEASRIAQVPLWTVHSWRRHGIVIPSVEWTDELNKVHTGHNFETVVFLRIIRLLRNKGLSLFTAVRTVRSIRKRLGTPSVRWANAKFFIRNRDIIVNDETDGWEYTVATKGHQKVAELLFGDEFKRLKERADALLIPEQFMDYVEIDPSIQNGLPIIFGTTVLTNVVHQLNIQRYEYSDIKDMYPFVPIDKIIGAGDYELFLDRAIKN
ncbi:hypothetical protein ACFLT0_01895 [Chloroflexota bacterium]